MKITNPAKYRTALARFLKMKRKNERILNGHKFRSQRREKMFRRKWRARLRSWKAPETWPVATSKPVVGIKRWW